MLAWVDAPLRRKVES